MRYFLTALSSFSLLLGACAITPANTTLTDTTGLSGSMEPVFFATNRLPSPDQRIRFTGDRDIKVHYGKTDIWIPDGVHSGFVSYPKKSVKPEKHYAMAGYRDINGDETFLVEINQALDTLPAGEEKVVFIYTHGFRIPFGHGLFRHAQIAHDFESEGISLFFSWPSAGETTKYLYDKESTLLARDEFAELLTLLSKSNASRISIMAHSMGVNLTMEALRTLSLKGEDHILKKISPLMLAAPDIDQDFFKDQIRDVRPLPDPAMVFVSDKDRALQLSQLLRGGHPRVGEGEDITALRALGLFVVDMSDFDDSQYRDNHDAFASSPTLLRMIQNQQLSRDTLLAAEADESRESGAASLQGLLQSVIFLPFRVMEEANDPK